MPEVVPNQAVLGFDTQIKPVALFRSDERGPVGAKVSERRWHGEPVRKSNSPFHGRGVLQTVGEPGRRDRFGDDRLTVRWFGCERRFQQSCEFFFLDEFLSVIRFVPDLAVFEAVGQRLSVTAVDGPGGEFDK